MVKEKNLQHFWGILFFCLPFSHPLLLWGQSSTIGGKFSVWSSFFLPFQDVFLLAILLISIYLIYKRKNLILPQIPSEFYLILIYSSTLLFIIKDPVLHLISLIHLFFLLLSPVFFHIFKIKWQIVIKYFLIAMFFVSLLAISQFYLQSSLNFNFLGEPYLSANTLGVAKIDYNNLKIIRAYGTFSHPNILAFFSIISFYLAEKIKLNKIKWWFILPLLLSFSRSAWLIFIFSLFFSHYKFTKKDFIILIGIIGLFIFKYHDILVKRLNIFDFSAMERWQGIKLSLEMLWQHPLGIGVKHFTIIMQNFNNNVFFPWEMQPVHNFYLLFANELGIISLIILIFLLIKIWHNSAIWQKPILFTMLSLGLFDHYLWTNYSAQFLFLFLLINSYENKKTPGGGVFV